MVSLVNKVSLITCLIFCSFISNGQNKYIQTTDSLIKTSSLDNTIEQLQEYQNNAIITNDSLLISTILYCKGKAYERKGQFENAFTSYYESINLSKKLNNKQIEGLNHIGLSNIDFRIGNNEQALLKGIKAAKLLNSINDTANYIQALITLGQVYISLDKFGSANDNYFEALELAKNTNDSVKLADVYDHIGVINTFRHNYKKALSYHFKALEINSRINENIHLGINYANIGEIYMFQRKYDKALEYLFKGLEILETADFTSPVIFINYIIGETYSKMNKSNDAIEYFNRSIKLIKETGEEREKPAVYRYISEHYERNNQLNKALKYYKLYSNINDSLTNENTIYKVDELRIKYDVEKKEQEIKALALEKKINEHALNTAKNTLRTQLLVMVLFIIGLICSIAFTIYFIWSRRSLKSLNNTKSMLFSIIGHDLRSPMGNIKQISDSLKTKHFDSNEVLFDLLIDQSEKAFNLLDDLLSWSRALNHKLDYSPGLVYIQEPINKVVEFCKPLSNKKNIKINIDVQKNPIVYADLNHLLTIFRNLITNAIKFSPNGGVIKIDSEEVSNKELRISIIDSGIGIESHNIDKILDLNKHFSSYGTQNEKGSGLGLKICLQFIKRNGGKLSISSQVGKGSKFSFTLPVPKSLS